MRQHKVFVKYKTKKKGGQRYLKNHGMAFTKVKRLTTPRSTTFYGINEIRPDEEGYEYEVSGIKSNAKNLATFKELAEGTEKYPKEEDRNKFPWYEELSDKEFKARQDKTQKESQEKYAESQKILTAKKIIPTEIVRLSEREQAHLGTDAKRVRDWDNELDKKLDVDFTKRIVKAAGGKESDVKVEDASEFIGLTPDEAHKKAFPPRQVVAPEDEFIELKPSIYNKKGKEGDFQIRGEGPHGTIDEIKKTFPGKKIKIDWGKAMEELE